MNQTMSIPSVHHLTPSVSYFYRCGIALLSYALFFMCRYPHLLCHDSVSFIEFYWLYDNDFFYTMSRAYTLDRHPRYYSVN
jgi:hypothetical protein